jgi:hypothetical protein
MQARSRLCAALCGLLLAGAAAAQTTLPDTDGDGVPDVMDNCINVPNADQADFDADGIGNACDADVNNDGIVNALDLAILRANFGRQAALGDLNGDGVVNALDLALMRRSLGRPPGPSGLSRVAPTPDGRRVPTAENLQLLRLAETLPRGYNALVQADFSKYFAALPGGRGTQTPVLMVFANGDYRVLQQAGITPVDLGQPNALGAKAGEVVVLNDLGLFGDERAGDGTYSGLARIDFGALDADAAEFLGRARRKQATRVIAFNGREAAAEQSFNPAEPFQPAGPPRTLSFTLPGVGPVATVAVPVPQLVPLLPPTTDADHTLLINALGVVQDPGRTFSPCNNAGAFVPTGSVNGAWSFKTLMSNMANQPLTGITPQVFINDWLKQWLGIANNVKHDDGVAVPSFPVPARAALLNVIRSTQPGWDPNNPASLDIDRLPLRLLAIVNRIDLAESGYIGTGSPGELRFVFGLLERAAGANVCIPSQEMTVILEYKVPTTSCTGLKLLANQWIALDTLVPGSPAYNGQLQALTNQVTLANAFPGRLNRSAIGQVRTNERRLGLPWELREFTLQKSPVFGKLLHETVKNTPDSTHNRTALLTNWMVNHAGETVPRQFGGVDFIGTANRYGPGVVPPDVPNPPWNGLPQVPTQKRFQFSLNTCSGCHLSETGTNFTMVRANGALGTPAGLAGFLTGITVQDAEYGAPPNPGGTFHHFNDLFRRGQILDQVAAKSCVAFPALQLIQAPLLLDLPQPPESIFGARFVH